MKFIFPAPPQFTPSDFCLKCDGCCRFAAANSKWSPCLLKEEIKAFGHRRIPFLLTTKSLRRGVRLKLIKAGKNFFCPFFSLQENRCRIYAQRPFDCRLYPFLLRRRNRKILLALDTNCAFVQQTSSDNKFIVYLKALIKYLNRPKVKRLIKSNRSLAGIFGEKEVVDVASFNI